MENKKHWKDYNSCTEYKELSRAQLEKCISDLAKEKSKKPLQMRYTKMRFD